MYKLIQACQNCEHYCIFVELRALRATNEMNRRHNAKQKEKEA